MIKRGVIIVSLVFLLVLTSFVSSYETQTWDFNNATLWFNNPGLLFSNHSYLNTTSQSLIVLDSFLSKNFLWIANAGEGSVSKINTKTNKEVARYYTNQKTLTNVESFILSWNGVPFSGDFDGDGIGEVGVFYPPEAKWYVAHPLYGKFFDSYNTAYYFGRKNIVNPKMVPGDYDGDGKFELGLYDPEQSMWYISSLNGTILADGLAFGNPGYIPFPGDYDGDGKYDLIMVKRAGAYPNINMEWRVRNLTNGFMFENSKNDSLSNFPQPLIVPRDYDGDRKLDRAYWSNSTGTWYIIKTTGGTYSTSFGVAGYIPVPADIDGDNRSDMVLTFSNNTAMYWHAKSITGASAFFLWRVFQNQGDIPVPGDYDGDGKAEFGAYNPSTGQFSIAETNYASGGIIVESYGVNNPSRIAVDPLTGDAYIGNRDFSKALIKIAAEESHCQDRNNNGIIDTSKDNNINNKIDNTEILEWEIGENSTDECVLWSWFNISEISGFSSGGIRAVALDKDQNIWAGNYDSSSYYKLSSEGKVLARVDNQGQKPYGAIIDKNKVLWSTNFHNGTITRINTTSNTFIDTITLSNPNLWGYSLAFDRKGYVWTSYWDGTGIMRMNASNPASNVKKYYNNGVGPFDIISGLLGGTRAVIADKQDNIWFTQTSEKTIYKINPESFNVLCSQNIGLYLFGVNEDSEGNIWVSGRRDFNSNPAKSYVIKIDKNTCQKILEIEIGRGTYTYSDATGALASNLLRDGFWQATLGSNEESQENYTKWTQISWRESSLEEGSYVNLTISFPDGEKRQYFHTLNNPQAEIPYSINLDKFSNNITVRFDIRKGNNLLSPIVSNLSIISIFLRPEERMDVSKEELPFFTPISFILALVSIALIYLLRANFNK